MTNQTELFHPECKRLALPAATTMVFVEGTLCGELEPIEIVRSGWPDFGYATLAYNPAAQQDAHVIDPEQMEDRFGMGRRISLRQLVNRIAPNVAVTDLPVFAGRIERIETTVNANGETTVITARDFGAVLQRLTVYGRRVAGSDGSTAFLSGLDTTFNPKGRPNAATLSVTLEGRRYVPFSRADADATDWTCAQAITYLLNEYLRPDQVRWPTLEQLLALTENQPVADLDVTGLSLLEALHRCCETAGIAFRFVPRLAETAPGQAIAFYRNGRGRQIELNRQSGGEQLSVSRTNVHTLHATRNLYPVTHRYIGQGDFKMFEATFDLVKAWDPALEDTDYTRFSPSTNPQFHEVRDVYRKWCLNEAGDYTSSPYNQGEAPDLSTILEGADYVRCRRRFWPALSAGAQGRSLGYHLEISYDAGLHWHPYLYAFNNLLDECGLWLSSDQLDVDAWVAALKGGLKLRLTASIVSDERLTAIVADGPVGSVAPVVDHLLTLPRRFRYRKVSPESIFYPADRQGLGTADEIDDSDALYSFVRRQATLSPAAIETTDVQTPTLSLHVHPGDRVTSSPESRDLFNCRRDNRSYIWIERVRIDFPNQCTDLKLIRQRI